MKKLNRKGFTLVELLVVIIVLGAIMIFAIPSILDSGTASQKKTFKLYAQKVLTEAQNYYQLETIEGTAITGITGCHTLEEIGLTGGDYQGSVMISQDETTGAISYSVYLANNNYAYVDASASDINGDTEPTPVASVSIDKISTCGS